MREQVQLITGGWFKYILIFLSLSISILNIISTLNKGYSLLSTMPLWLPFIVIPFLSLFMDFYNLLFLSGLIAGLMLTIVQDDKSDLQGVFPFILALRFYEDKIGLLTTFFTILTGILGRSIILGMNINETLLLLIAYIVFIMISYAPKVLKKDV